MSRICVFVCSLQHVRYLYNSISLWTGVWCATVMTFITCLCSTLDHCRNRYKYTNSIPTPYVLILVDPLMIAFDLSVIRAVDVWVKIFRL